MHDIVSPPILSFPFTILMRGVSFRGEVGLGARHSSGIHPDGEGGEGGKTRIQVYKYAGSASESSATKDQRPKAKSGFAFASVRDLCLYKRTAS